MPSATLLFFKQKWYGSHTGRAVMANLKSPQTKRDEGEAVVGLAIRTTVHLLPQAHQQVGGRHNRTTSVSETHVPNRAGLGMRTLRYNGE